MSNLKFNYDKKHDILYISIGNPVPSYGDEELEGIILRRDMVTDELTGITILDFMKRLSKNDNSLNAIPIKIDYSSIVNNHDFTN